MRTRIIAAFIAIPIVIIPIYLGGIWGLAFGVVVTVVGCLEMFDMLRKGGYNPATWLGLVWAVMLFLSGWDPQQVQASSIPITGWFTAPTVRLIELVSFPTATVLIAGFIVTLTYSLFVIDKPINTWLATSMVAIYLGVTLGQVVSLRFLPNGFWYVMFGLLVTWANDSAALFVGVSHGAAQAVAAAEPQEDVGRHDRRLDRRLVGRSVPGVGTAGGHRARSLGRSWASWRASWPCLATCRSA